MSRFFQDFRLELWGFDALMPDGTYLFVVFADTIILGTRHGITIGLVFPPDAPAWGMVRRVSGNLITCESDRPQISFGHSYFRREPDKISAYVQAAGSISLDYEGPFRRYDPQEPVWEQGERRISWVVPALRVPVRVQVENGSDSWTATGDGIHAYIYADFNPFKVPLQSLSVGHVHGEDGNAFYCQAELSNGATRSHLVIQQGETIAAVTSASDLSIRAGGPHLSGPGAQLLGSGCRQILSGSPVALLDNLPGWILMVARQITPGVEMAGWVGDADLQWPEGSSTGALLHAGISWP